jgi:hypothetical protein
MELRLNLTRMGLVLVILLGGLHTARAFYDPGSQRWLNRDPLGDNGNLAALTADFEPSIDRQDSDTTEKSGDEMLFAFAQINQNLHGFGLNNPISLVDAYGLDICVQNTPAVNGWHERIAVGNPNDPNDLYGQSYGMANRNAKMQGSFASLNGQPAAGKGGSGIVYDDNAPAIKTPLRFKTTPKEDDWAKQQLQKELNNTGPYHWLLNNCRGYSKDRYNKLVRAIRQQRGEKSPVLLTPRQQRCQGK